MGTYDKSKFFDVRTYKKPENEQSTYYDVRKAYVYDNIEKISQSISSRINSWYKNSNAFLHSSANRYLFRTGTYIDPYVSDSADYLNYLTKKKSEFAAEYNEINEYINRYADYLDTDAVNSTVSSLKKAYEKSYSEFDNILNAANSDVKYWSQWKDEKEYNDWAKAEKEYYYNYGIVAERSDFKDVSSKGLDKYAKEKAASEKAAAEKEKDLKWWEQALIWIGQSQDNTMPLGTMPSVIDDYRNDTSYNEISDDWTQDQKNIFGYLYQTDVGKAKEFARYTNNQINEAKKNESLKKVTDWATKNFGTGFAATAGSVLTMPLSLVDTMDSMAQYIAKGEIDTHSSVMPGEFSTAIRSSIANKLNEHGTIKDDLFVVGGKGWGDVYQLGTSIADSLLVGSTQGPLGTYVAFFGSASASGIQDAKSRGATDDEALTFGILSGLAEAAGEAFSVEKLFSGGITSSTLKGFFTNILRQGGFEASEEAVTSALNTLSDAIVMKDKSSFNLMVQELMAKGYSKADAEKAAAKQFFSDLAFDALGGFISGGVSAGITGGVGAVGNFVDNTVQGSKMQKAFGSEVGPALVNEALEIDANNKFAQKMQSRVEGGKKLSNHQIGALVQQNESGMRKNDRSKIKAAVASRFEQLGERSDNMDALAEAITKKTLGESLDARDRALIKNSTFGQRVLNEMNAENIKSGQYSSAWAESIDTDRIGVAEYSRLIKADTDGSDDEKAEIPHDVATKPNTAETVAQIENAAEAVKIEEMAEIKPSVESTTATTEENKVVPPDVTGAETVKDVPNANVGTIEEVAKSDEYKASPSVATMVQAYESGQDASRFASEYDRVFNYAYSGTMSLDRVTKSGNFSTLTQDQIKAAYNAGANAAKTKAEGRDNVIRTLANGKTGRKKGVVKGDGVSINDLRSTFNDTQNVAYKVLSRIAEVTGIDIVLYKSETNEKGEFVGAQGKYDRVKDPGTLYIDINAGLKGISDVGRLTRYTMLRTFSHEFSHFIENWSPIWYNELRSAVFEQLSEYGEDVDGLIQTKMEQSGLDYDMASREVVAQALTDVLDDSSFVNNLAEKHKNVFNKLLEKLKEFLADIKAYFSSIETNNAKEAKAMKKQIGDAMHYVESIVELFDKAAVGAVENYQQTVAVDEALDEVVAEDSKATEEVAAIKTATTTSENGYTITDDAENRTISIKFDGKPIDAVREALKNNAFVWNKTKGEWFRSGKWYDKNKASDVISALDKVYTDNKQENVVKNQSSAEKIDSTDAIKADNNAEKGAEKKKARSEEEKQSARKKQIGSAVARLIALSPERQKYLADKFNQYRGILEQLEKGDKLINDNGDVVGEVVNISDGCIFIVGEEGFVEMTLPKSFTDDGIIAVLEVGDGHFEKADGTRITEKTTEAPNTKTEPTFTEIFENATQAEKDEVVEAINKNTKLSHMTPTEIRGETKEAKPNGTGNAYNQGTVENADSSRQGDPRVLDEVETEDVQGTASEGNAVEGTEERGREAVRDDVRVGSGTESSREPSLGDNQSGDLRRNDWISEEEKSARDYAEEQGYKIALNDLSSKKGVTQVDISDKNGLPTFNPIIINTASDWNKVKEAIDIREESEKAKAEQFHEEVKQEIEQKSTEQPKGKNFVIGDSLDLPNGEKARYKANIEAIRLVKKLEAEGRYATKAEQVVLSKYVGWGGLANAFDERKADWAKEFKELKELLTEEEYSLARGSTLNAHYTEISVIKAMYDGLAGLGFTGGRMLEPSSGVGNFVGAMPATMASKVKSWTMVELDGITGLIAKYLYPNADVRIQGFEKTNIPNNYMDVAIGNVPFGNYPIVDSAYPKKVTSAIHNYFFAKSLDKVRPGGIVMFITSAYTMNSKDSTVRQYIMKHADLLGAIRLPDTAFKGNAGTEVVTDILILKKRVPGTSYAGVDFLNADYQYIDGYRGAFINNYFKEHPEMALGTPSMAGSMYARDTLTYKALEGKGTLADQIREAFKHIEGKMDYPAQPTKEKTNFAVEKASKKTKENGYVIKDGKVYQNENGELVEKQVAKGVAQRIDGILKIRDSAKKLLAYQQQGLKEDVIKAERENLNKLYDAFVKANGFLNASANKSAFGEDPDSFFIFALENYNSKTKKATKADIFSVNTVSPNRTVTTAADVAEGLIVSRNETGGVDVPLIAKLTNKSEADVTRELIDSRLAFKNRDGVLEPAETYLSGNVRAKLRDAQGLVPIDADYKNNVEALEAIIPKDVSYEEIFVNPGTPWIPNSVYSDFAAYMLGGRNSEYRNDVEIRRNETGNFTVQLNSSYLKYNASNTQKWGTPKRSFLDLFDAMLNSRSVVVKYKTDDGQTIVDKDATAAANEKIENIQKEFGEWLWKDEARRNELSTLYNETFNSIVTPKYNGANLSVNGMRAGWDLRPHQKDAVQRVVSSGGNTLLAHKVGAGKTFEMAASAMKLKELGLIKKPMFVVPKSLVAQWGKEFTDYFPAAKLLVTDAKEFTASNRKIYANKIANGTYDAVIVSYEQFEKLPMSRDYQEKFYQDQIDTIITAIEEQRAESGKNALSVKDLEKKKKSLEAKLQNLSKKPKDENNIEFEQLGVDGIFVDEAHNFKNLFYNTSMTNVSGLGNKDGSNRAFDLYAKVRYLQQLNGGRGIVFATATPVMNSMSEMYIMQKYLQPDLLKQLGLDTFDAWAKQFGEVVNGVEIKPSGQGYRVKQSFSRFKNLSELQLLFRNFADVLTDIPGLKIPKMKGGRVNVVECDAGQFQKDFMKELEKRADNVKNVDPSVDNMLKITSDGRKISYTQRMIDPTLPYEEGCKIYKCADNVAQEYNASKSINGTQIVFMDMATPKGKSKADAEEVEMDTDSAKLYEDFRARLVKLGIPANEIAFIHDADTDAKKKELFANVNDGKVRVLIGSTAKMGVGMNAQKRMVAIHHLDAPWRPGDVEQRDGRVFRQGNINDEVSKYTYVTVGSFDARLWDILDRKSGFINQIMNGDNVGRETEDTGEVTLSAAEVKALASGSPLILEQVQLDTDIKKLESLYRSHVQALANARNKLAKDQADIAMYESKIEAGNEDIKNRTDSYLEGKFAITIGKNKYTDKKEAGVALIAEAQSKATLTEYNTIGKFAGFDLRVIRTSEGISGVLVGKQSYPFKTYPDSTTVGINHLISKVEGISSNIENWQEIIKNLRTDMAEQETLMNVPFAKQAELDQKRARYKEVMEILSPKEEQKLESIDEGVQEQSREYLDNTDADYLDAVNRGDMETAQRMLDAYAIEQGMDVDEQGGPDLLFHGTDSFGFTVLDTSKSDDQLTFWATPNMGVAGSYYRGSDYKVRRIGKDKITAKAEKISPYLSAEKRLNMARPYAKEIGIDLSKARPIKESVVMNRAKKHIQKAVEFAERVESGNFSEKVKQVARRIIKAQEQGTYEAWHRTLNNDSWINFSNATGVDFATIDMPDNFDINKSDVSKVTDAHPDVFKMMYHAGDVYDAIYQDLDESVGNDQTYDDVLLNYNEWASEKGIYAFYHKQENPFIYDCEYTKWNKIKVPAEAKADILTETTDTRTLAEWAFAHGYDAIRLDNVSDYGGWKLRDASKYATIWAFKNPQAQLKSADPVTYDDNGNVIPLSERFNSENDDIRNQNRDDTLTDTEVLEMATAEIDASELTEGERSAFDIWKKHLTNIRTFEDQRAELGTLYKEQNFTKGADRKEAAKTLERMKILDSKLKAESDKLFEIEQKSVLQSILKKARKVVEQKERAHGQELLKRYRERRENAAAIKKYRDRIKADVSELSKWILHPDNKNNLKHVPDVLKNTVIDFLTSVDFTSQKQLAGKGATKADEAFAQRMKALRSAMKEDLDVGGIYSGYNDLPDDFMETLDKFIEITEKLAKSAGTDFVINKMSAEELRSLSKIVKNLKKFVTMFNAFHSNAIYQHVSDAGDNSIEFMQGITPATNANKTTNFLFWQQMRSAYAFERFGEGGKAIYDGLRRGQAKLAFNTKKIVDFAKKTYTAEEVKAWEKADKVINLPSGGTIRMKVSQIMGFYELSKQPDSLRHILQGGIRVATYKGGENDRGRALTYADIASIVEALTPRQKAVADAMQKFMAEQGGKWGNYVTMARFGEEQFTNSQYYPINSDGRLLDVNADEKPGGAELYALLNLSFTKSRNENANNRIVVYSIFDVFSNHMASMAQYNALALPVLDAVKWLNYKQVEVDEAGNKMVLGRVREEMNVAYGTPEEKGKNAKGYAESFVINIIKDFNGTAAQGTPYDSLGLKALHNYNRAQIAYNVRVVVQQPMAITRAAMLLDYKSIIKGMKLSPSAIKANVEEMREHSGIAAWKALGFYDVNISRGVTSLIKQEETWLDKIVEFGMKGAEAADTLTWQAIWSACKEQVQRKQKLNPNDKGYFDAVTTLFEDVIYKTQVVDSILTKTEFMRDKGFWARATGSFMSEPTTTASMILDVYDKFRLDMRKGMSFKDAWGKNGRAIGRLAVVYALGAIMLAAAQGVIDAYRDDDEYEEWYEKWLEAFRGNLVDEFMPFNKLPLVADFYDLVKELVSIFGVDTYGNPPQSVYMQWYDTLVKAVEIFHDKITGEDTNYTWYAFVYKMLQTASGISGLPISTTTRTIIGAWNNTVGAMAPSLKVKDYDAGPLANLKYAFKDGYLSEEEATKLLLEEGLAEDENEAYYYIQEWSDEDGKYSKYDALKDALASGEGFEDAMNELITHGKTEKEVISQVKSIIGTMVKEEGLSEDEAIRLLTEYADLDNDEARKKVDYWAFVRDNPKGYDRLNEASYAKYKEMCEPYGVSIDAYYKAYTFRNDTNNDEELTSMQKKRKIRDYIYQMDIPTDHKRKLIACWF